ncbi:hypothetical protein E4U17_005763 [Claviceps sp. LM77 group G4]|nr:hypothetical protein E4U17_005763 [Claviceps sp. LM77 group G4]KAG6079674.1 hypothetical protein E4U33_000116 [Claviceps sp. LM78 group G4]KAG6084251.1 hypothetical protein E4U16_002288 [Claviceps sp. LM84 group G4]
MKPDRADRAIVQELIQTLKHAGAKQAHILKAVNTQLSAEHQRAIISLQDDLDKPDINSLRELIESLVLIIPMDTRQATILEKVNAHSSMHRANVPLAYACYNTIFKIGA